MLRVLEALGFKIKRHSARVVLFTPLEKSSATHMFLTVDLPEGRFVADPGFGGPASTTPLPLTGEHVGRHRIVRDGALWALLDNGIPAWYSTLAEDYEIDFEMGNHFVASHSSSPFVQRILMSRFTENGRISVMNRDVKIIDGGETRSYQLTNRAELRAFLIEHFGFDLPAVETMRVPAIPEWVRVYIQPGRRRRNHLEQDDIAFAQPSCSRCVFDRVIQTSGDSASGHHALCLIA